jgi:hypothetical protein
VYSAGQLLSADSLRLGQTYVQGRFALQRFIDGIGIVCGLHVRCDPDHPGWVIVDPGYALDCCGRDIVLCEPIRFNVCKAIMACPRPAVPCEEVEEATEKPAEKMVRLSAVQPLTERKAYRRKAVITGLVTSSETEDPIAGAVLSIASAALSSVTDSAGRYRMDVPALGQAVYRLTARAAGYLPANREVTLRAGSDTVANFPLDPVEEKVPTPAPAFDIYALRIEGTWEGRAPVPVVTSRNGCDPRPVCRPSKEITSARLCITPMAQEPISTRFLRRTQKFKALAEPLLDRIDDALTAVEAAGANQPEPGEVVADTLLQTIREAPLRSSCNLEAMLCDVRLLMEDKPPKCFSFPTSVEDDPDTALARILGQLIDDRREEYLVLGCDDCCEQVGVRLALVLSQDLPNGCGQQGCSIAGLDANPPSREVLHPRSDWWLPFQVVVYDAYFRGGNEAGVLLTARGLEVDVSDVSQSNAIAAIPDKLNAWLKAHDSEKELARLALYATSELYVPYSSQVTLWTLEGRVVAITHVGGRVQGLPSHIRGYAPGPYVAYPMAGRVRPSSISLPEEPSDILTAPEARVAETPRSLDPGAMDPAPLRELIDGIGPKIESALFRLGRTTLRSLLRTSEEEVTGLMRPDQLERIKAQARRILDRKESFAPRDLEEWAAAARVRKEHLERSPE